MSALRSALCRCLLVALAHAASAAVTVEEVAPDSALVRAGIAAGDSLVAWRQGERGGTLDSPFDAWWLEAEVKPCGAVELVVSRQGAELPVEVARGAWDVDVRPPLDASLVDLYRAARGAAEAGDAGAVEELERLAAALPGGTVERRWAEVELGRVAARLGLLESAWRAFDRAAAAGADAVVERGVLRAYATALAEAGERARAEELWRRVTELEAAAWGDGPALAESLGDWSGVRFAGDDVDGAVALVERALAILRRRAPGSLVLAVDLDRRAQLADLSGDAGAARGLLAEAWEIAHRLGAGAVEARVWQSRAFLAYRGGDRPAAKAALRQALDLYQAHDPEGRGAAGCLSNLGVLAEEEGRFDDAAGHYQRALAATRRRSPGSLDEADLLVNLGVLARRRGDLRGAEASLAAALAIQQRRAASPSALAATLADLGNLANQRGQRRLAEERYNAALELLDALPFAAQDAAVVRYDLAMLALDHGEADAARPLLEAAAAALRQPPDTLGLAKVLGGLGLVARAEGDLTAAEEAFRRALDAAATAAPGGPEHAVALADLAEVELRRGRSAAAASGFRSALAVWRRLEAEGVEAALCHYGLARLAWREGRSEEAGRGFADAIRLLDLEAARLGVAPELRARFRAAHRRLHVDYVRFLVDQGDVAGAFGALEGYRGRSFLERLAERDLDFSADLPDGLEARRRALLGELEELAAPGDEGAAPGRAARVEELRQALHRTDEEIRRQAPPLAELRDPRPADLAATRQALDGGTLLLSYLVGTEDTLLFAVDREGARVVTLAVGEAALEESVRRFRRLITEARPGALGERRRAALVAAGAALYRQLLAPVEERLESAPRLLVLADGPLHELPFAALVRGDGRFLIETKPLSLALSATIWRQLHDRRRGPPPAPRLVAFGDPGVAPPVARRGVRGAELPASRMEVERIAALYDGRSELFLGAAATAANAIAAAPHADVLHFATHGRLDAEDPLASALLFAPAGASGTGEEELQVWEIFERLRTAAEVVVLSACDSARGARLGGDGILGLTRAFQYAGARSVVASLWPVSDRRTAELMVALHRRLTAGSPAAEALQAAQRELLGRVFYPYYWAAFQLYGD